LDQTNRLLTFMPAALVGAMACDAASLRLSLGHWPVMYRDEAVGISALLDAVTIFLLLATIWGAPPWLLSLYAVNARRGRRAVMVRIAGFVGGIAVLFVIAHVNPYGFVEWWLD
jgi:hypothetical protein